MMAGIGVPRCLRWARFVMAVLALGTLAWSQGTPLATASDKLAGHVLRRTSFGPTPALLNLLASNTSVQVPAYVTNQIFNAPNVTNEVMSADLSQLVASIVPAAGADWSITDLQKYQLALATWSDWQLREVMTHFWHRHFSTHFDIVAQYYGANYFLLFLLEGIYGPTGDILAAPADYTGFELNFNPLLLADSERHLATIVATENQAFRANALGTFRDLLYASAQSPAMVLYLHSFNNIILSVGQKPNLDYARELMELHTLGKSPDGQPNGYTEADINEVGRCFSGWSVRQELPGKLGFHYRDYFHDNFTPKGPFLLGTGPGLSLPANNGINDGNAVLDYLAQADLTKDFICRKLIKFFITEEVITPANSQLNSLLVACKAAWGQFGDIKAVLNTILGSTAFRNPVYRWNKVSMPAENLIATVRLFGGRATTSAQLDNLHNALGALDHRFFKWPAPDGHPIESTKWVSSLQMLERSNFQQQIHKGYVSWLNPANWANDISYDLMGFLTTAGIPNNNQGLIVDHLFRYRYQDQAGASDRSLANTFIGSSTTGGLARTFAWLIQNNQLDEYGDRLYHFISYVCSLPAAVQK